MLELKNISKIYGDFALRDINLHIKDGEYFVLLGRSGAGKSQLLELIAGLRSPDTGSIRLKGRDITNEKMQKRKTAMVFQDFAIFPHLTVYGNIAYSLKIKKLNKAVIDNRVREMAGNVNISHLLNRKTNELSGGERQRIAVARALVTSPEIILLDEPMASIDATLRDDVRRLLRNINAMGITILHVTHDYREAVRLASRVGVIHNGRILQTGEPDMVFSKPVNRFVARFAGIRNFYSVRIVSSGGSYVAESDFNSFVLPPGNYAADGLLMIRSDAINLSGMQQKDCENCIKGRITEINRAESGYELFVDAGDIFHVLISRKEIKELSLAVNKNVFLCFPAGELQII